MKTTYIVRFTKVLARSNEGPVEIAQRASSWPVAVKRASDYYQRNHNAGKQIGEELHVVVMRKEEAVATS